MLNNTYFFVMLTLFSFYIGSFLSKKFKNPIVNPMLISVSICILFLKFTGISYEDYMTGGKFITFLLGPSTVALVIPLYRNIELVKKNLSCILIGVFVGSLTAILSAFILCKIFNLNDRLTLSLLPQSITTAIGLPISENIGGIGAVTVFAIIFRGILGAIICVPLFKLFKIKNPIAKGIAIGTSSHVIGTSKALEIGETEGAMGGLSIAIAGILTSIYVIFL